MGAAVTFLGVVLLSAQSPLLDVVRERWRAVEAARVELDAAWEAGPEQRRAQVALRAHRAAVRRLASVMPAREWVEFASLRAAQEEWLVAGVLPLMGEWWFERQPRSAIPLLEAYVARFPDEDRAVNARSHLLPRAIMSEPLRDDWFQRLGRLESEATGGEREMLAVVMADALAVRGDLAGARARLEAIPTERPGTPEEWAAAVARDLAPVRLAMLGKPMAPLEPLAVLGARRERIAAHDGPVLVAFWEPWCGPCLNEMRMLGDLAAATRDDGLLVLGVTTGGASGGDGSERPLDEITRVRREQRPGYPFMLVDPSYFRAHGVDGVPVLALLDASRTVRFVYAGPDPQGWLRQALAQLLDIDASPRPGFAAR